MNPDEWAKDTVTVEECKEKRGRKMKTITLRVEDCYQVVIDDLIDAYHGNNKFDRVDCSIGVLEPDHELLRAIRTVLSYYMTQEDYREWAAMNPAVKEGD